MDRAFCNLTMVALAFVLAACHEFEEPQIRERDMTRISAPWATTSLNETYVVRTDGEWARVWQLHEPRTFPPTPRPAVDFGSKMVLGVTKGSGPNGCYSLRIARILETVNELQVEFVQSGAPQGVICTQAIVALTDFVVTDTSEKAVVFKSSVGG